MNILVTGAKGFVGKNLCMALKNVRDGKDRTREGVTVENIYEYDLDNSLEELNEFCGKADFVFNLAGVNRPENKEDFIKGNCGFTDRLLSALIENNNKCPIMLSSSLQASLVGRYDNEYGRSKNKAEEIMLEYSEKTGAKVMIYRFPNLFGKWCRPNYNSAVATFCNNIANDIPINVNDESTELILLYIDDLIDEMFSALRSKEHRCDFDGLNVLPNDDGMFCYCPITHTVTLGKIVDCLYKFKSQSESLIIPEIPNGSFEKKLYSTFVSYLPKDKVKFPLKMNCDDRGSFTELLKTENCGQFSINISKPGITKGQHWHNSKWEFFIVVAGKALIQERKIGSDEILNFYVSGEKIEAVHMLPGYTHNIINLSETEDLVTVMWANEMFEPNKPDTFFEIV